MSSTPKTINLEGIFNAALAKYTNQTGHDISNHPLASTIDGCDSAESILAIFQEQAKAFHEFRHGDPKLMKWLQPVVTGLYALSASPALSDGVSFVSPQRSFFSDRLLQYPHHVGVPSRITIFFRHQCSSVCAYPSALAPLTLPF